MGKTPCTWKWRRWEWVFCLDSQGWILHTIPESRPLQTFKGKGGMHSSIFSFIYWLWPLLPFSLQSLLCVYLVFVFRNSRSSLERCGLAQQHPISLECSSPQDKKKELPASLCCWCCLQQTKQELQPEKFPHFVQRGKNSSQIFWPGQPYSQKVWFHNHQHCICIMTFCFSATRKNDCSLLCSCFWISKWIFLDIQGIKDGFLQGIS